MLFGTSWPMRPPPGHTTRRSRSGGRTSPPCACMKPSVSGSKGRGWAITGSPRRMRSSFGSAILPPVGHDTVRCHARTRHP
jgi:hypothetical protein